MFDLVKYWIENNEKVFRENKILIEKTINGDTKYIDFIGNEYAGRVVYREENDFDFFILRLKDERVVLCENLDAPDHNTLDLYLNKLYEFLINMNDV
jgi:hypothetical protein